VRVSLLYNEDAGVGVTLGEIRRTIERRGHELVCVVEKDSGEVRRVLDASTDLVVAAGGDGTVGTLARLLAGRGVPLAILPLGTANNIAKSLGYTGSIEQLVARWDDARPMPLDLGVASGTWGEQWFVEGVGTGLIPAGISAMSAERSVGDAPVNSQLARAARKFNEVLARTAPRRLTLILDGLRTTDDFVLFEVLNIRSIGPNIVLSGDADPGDGVFCVVMAGKNDRTELARYLQHLAEGKNCPLSLYSRRAKQIEIQGGTDFHVDDRVFPQPFGGSASIRIEPAALEFWA
jgi:diacylglycerol kinase family enzyme